MMKADRSSALRKHDRLYRRLDELAAFAVHDAAA
jgi:hypothetical protein